MQSSVVAVITDETQNDIIAGLHAAGMGHLTRVIRRERGHIAGQLDRAGIEIDELPDPIVTADRTVLVTPTARPVDTACIILQRGAISAWTLTSEEGWQAIDDKAIEIAATSGLPARPVSPPHRSSRTFRKQGIRRRPRRGVNIPASEHDSENTSAS
jgi:hypothetical protein